MSKQKRKFSRPYVERFYRKFFVIAVEGEKTEKGYFDIFRNMQSSIIDIKCLNSKTDSSPFYVLKRMKNYLVDKELKKTDEAWLVVDKDQWTDEQLKTLCGWAHTRDNYGLALSNPKFEYWLLLHFEDGDNIKSSTDCDNRLKQYIPDYAKKIHHHKFTRERIESAVTRAKQRDNPPCEDWPRNPGGTTVYKLVEKILRA